LEAVMVSQMVVSMALAAMVAHAIWKLRLFIE
jgi:hypothetical protein